MLVSQKDRDKITALSKQLFSTTEVLEVKRLGGMTNFSYSVALSVGDYVFRLPGKGTEALINRRHEAVSNRLACEIEVDVPLLYFDLDSGIKVSKFIEAAETMSPESMREEKRIAQAAKLFHTLHNSGVDTKVPFEVFDMAQTYEKIIKDNGVSFFEDYEAVRQKVFEINNQMSHLNFSKAPCHNDPLCENWVCSPERMYLIDWEYAGMNDPLWDLADLSIEAEYDSALDSLLLSCYFEKEATDEEEFRFKANKIYLDFLWSLWGKTRVPFDGEPMEAYAANRYERLKKNLILV